MSKQTIPFSSFADAAGAEHADFISQMHDYMQEYDCRADIKEAANGYVVSYVYKPTGRTVVNYVFRKRGLMLRIYADNIFAYMDVLAEWPETMKDTIRKAAVCKRLLNPAACNPRCTTGYDFILNDERQQKCKYNCFMFLLDSQKKPPLKAMVEQEIQIRKKAINSIDA